jgi:hypothetical protein
MIKKQLNKNTTITIEPNSTTIKTCIGDKFWEKTQFIGSFGFKQVTYKSNVCDDCDDTDDVKYMNEADACLCFQCREAVGLEIIAEEQWEETKRSLMGVI